MFFQQHTLNHFIIFFISLRVLVVISGNTFPWLLLALWNKNHLFQDQLCVLSVILCSLFKPIWANLWKTMLFFVNICHSAFNISLFIYIRSFWFYLSVFGYFYLFILILLRLFFHICNIGYFNFSAIDHEAEETEILKYMRSNTSFKI